MAAVGGWQAGLHLVAGLDISFPPGGAGDGGADGSTPAVAPQQHALDSPASRASVTIASTPAAATAACPIAALAVLTFPGLQLRHLELLPLVSEHALRAPYIPGFLAFREVPAYLELLRRVAAKGVYPQLLLVDGFGVLHPRRCGSASTLGVLSGLPTVGVAKHLLHLDGLLSERQLRTAAGLAAARQRRPDPVPADGAAAAASDGGSDVSSSTEWRPLPSSGGEEEGRANGGSRALWLPLADSSGEVLGAALCCPQAGQAAPDGSSSCSRPTGGGFQRLIYVSTGHRVSLATALAVVAQCCKHRVPEPVRQADLLSRAEVRRQLHRDSTA